MVVIIYECQRCKRRDLEDKVKSEFVKKYFPHDWEEAKKELELLDEPKGRE